MTNFTRRTMLQGGTALATAGALDRPGAARLGESLGAIRATGRPRRAPRLTLLRWKQFIQAEEDAFMALVANFTKATGVNVSVIDESLDDVQPKASVAANINSGPDMFWGLYSLPHLFPTKVVDVTDIADYLGKKYGGWVPSAIAYGKSGNKWIDIPVAYNGNMHELPQGGEREGRLQRISENHRRVPRLRQGDEGARHAGRLGARPRLGRRQCLGALVPVDLRRQSGRREGQGHPQFARDGEGAGIRQATLPDLHSRNGVVERCLQQQGIPRRRVLLDR